MHSAGCTAGNEVTGAGSSRKNRETPPSSYVLLALSGLSLLVPAVLGATVYRLCTRGEHQSSGLLPAVFIAWSVLIASVCLYPSRMRPRRHRRRLDGLGMKLAVGSITALFVELAILVAFGS